MKKGFTLIELLAVIIILAIVALIATPIVLDVVDDARTSAAKSEAAMIVSGINNYCATAEMKAQLNNTTSECEEGVTVAQVAKMVDLGNAKVLNLTYDKKVTYLKVESNTKTVEYDGSTYKIDGETTGTPGGSSGSTFAAYSVGTEVTLSDDTVWVVVEDSAASENEIKIMSLQNIHPNLTTETGTAMFVSEENGEYAIAYDTTGTSHVWETSTLKVYFDSIVKPRLEASLNTTISDITIWGIEELTALGCVGTGNNIDGYTDVSCDKTKPWYSKVFSTTSWTTVPFAPEGEDPFGYELLCPDYKGRFMNEYIGYASDDGARPLITVSKSVIKQ